MSGIAGESARRELTVFSTDIKELNLPYIELNKKIKKRNFYQLMNPFFKMSIDIKYIVRAKFCFQEINFRESSKFRVPPQNAWANVYYTFLCFVERR